MLRVRKLTSFLQNSNFAVWFLVEQKQIRTPREFEVKVVEEPDYKTFKEKYYNIKNGQYERNYKLTSLPCFFLRAAISAIISLMLQHVC